jgi:hypothetical protein
MKTEADSLYELLPRIYRQRDQESGGPLRRLVEILASQVKVVRQDIEQLYENWFIETADDWAVPYIADLLGYEPAADAGTLGDPSEPATAVRNSVLAPRREIANTLRYRRRKGTLALLELIVRDVANWPARAVEFYRLLVFAQHMKHLRPVRGRSCDLRDGETLELAGGTFDTLAHTVDVRRINSQSGQGLYNLPTIGLFVWRLRTYPVTKTPAACLEHSGSHAYSFSALGNDTPLFHKPEPEPAPDSIAGESNVPGVILRRRLDGAIDAFYGPGKSFAIYKDSPADSALIPASSIVVADLNHWQYRPRKGAVAVDPVRGRIAFSPAELPRQGVWVTYHYGFSADIGGGEYPRTLLDFPGSPEPAPGETVPDKRVYPVGAGQTFERIAAAVKQWLEDGVPAGIIEIRDSAVFSEQLVFDIPDNRRLMIRAASRKRPVIRLLDWQTSLPDSLAIRGGQNSRVVLDGLLITGRAVRVSGPMAELVIRHCTLVPGWALDPACNPKRPSEPSLELAEFHGRLRIEHSITGAIQIYEDAVRRDPVACVIDDSVIDATSDSREAIGAPGCLVAHTTLTVKRSTLFGLVQVHELRLAEDSIFMVRVFVARRQNGCVRFCYVAPKSKTPRRYRCQPIEGASELEQRRVRPVFTSVRYGMPGYCQLARACPAEIHQGASDSSEMGVFHSLFQPQREAILRARLNEFTPAGMEAGIVFVD